MASRSRRVTRKFSVFDNMRVPTTLDNVMAGLSPAIAVGRSENQLKFAKATE